MRKPRSARPRPAITGEGDRPVAGLDAGATAGRKRRSPKRYAGTTTFRHHNVPATLRDGSLPQRQPAAAICHRPYAASRGHRPDRTRRRAVLPDHRTTTSNPHAAQTLAAHTIPAERGHEFCGAAGPRPAFARPDVADRTVIHSSAGRRVSHPIRDATPKRPPIRNTSGRTARGVATDPGGDRIPQSGAAEVRGFFARPSCDKL